MSPAESGELIGRKIAFPLLFMVGIYLGWKWRNKKRKQKGGEK